MRAMVIGVLCCFFLAWGARAQSAPAISAEQKIIHPPGAYATVNGAKMWYESEGSGEPLLLIAGGPGDAHYFHPYFSAMASSVRVISFDAFGRGKSDRAKSPSEYTFSRDVADIEGLRKALGLGKIALLGHSYGGMVAQAYALKYPENLSKLILADTLFSGEMWQANNDSCNYELRNQFPEMWDKVQELRSAGLHSSAKEHQKAYDLPQGLLYFHDASIAEKLPKEANDTNTEVYYAIVGDDGDFLIGGDIAALDFRAQLKTLKMPTLIVTGRYDRVALPRFAVQFKKYAPQAQFVMFEHSGHLPFIEEPEEFFRLLRDFLAANSK